MEQNRASTIFSDKHQLERKTFESYEVIVNLIGSTRTRKGLTVRIVLDTNQYEKGKKISDEEMKKINILRHEFHGDWNYTIKPNL